MARLHLAAQGLVRAEVNEIAVNGDATDATRVDYVRALARTYDVTDLCTRGDNVLDLTIAGGEWERTRQDPRTLATLVMEFDDGERLHVGTSASMLAAPSRVTEHEPFYRERHDGRLSTRVFAPSSLLRAVDIAVFPDSAATAPRNVEVDLTPPIRNVLAVTPREVSRKDGVRVYDVGVNVAGRTRLSIQSALPPGTELRVVHGEHLDNEGRLDTTNITMPYDHGRLRQSLEFALAGHSDEICEPWFSYHGFRYVEVQGLPNSASVDLVVHTHHSDLSPVSDLSTNDSQTDALITRGMRTLLNTLHGIPEDCPTREQAGWTGDAAAVAEFECSVFDCEGFLGKWLGDLRTSQQADGAIPAIAPDVRDAKAPSDPVWGSALHRILINHWYHYGDLRVVHDNLPALRRWADYLWTLRDHRGIVSGAPISYGHDWLALEQTPPEILHTAATIDCLRVLAELEDVAGLPAHATPRREAANTLAAAARARFYDTATRHFGNSSQGALSCAIAAGILEDDDAHVAATALAADCRERGNRISTGYGATRTAVAALAMSGNSQAIFDAVHQPDEPGIGAMLDHGPGTFWECLWIDPTNTGTGSLNHVGHGGVFAGWAVQSLAGVRPTAGGFSRYIVAPQFVAGLTELTLNMRTVRGDLRIHYRRDDATAQVELTVPVGSEATVTLPGDGGSTALGPGHHTLTAPWPDTSAVEPPPVEKEWQPPSVTPLSADEAGHDDLLSAALRAGLIEAPNATINSVPSGIRCMPIPHAQHEGPVVAVTSAGQDDTSLVGHITLAESLSLTHSTFVYGTVDTCGLPDPQQFDGVIALVGADGTRRESVGRLWPAGWNRVAIDTAGWPTGELLRCVELGIKRSRTDSVDRGASAAPQFHIGKVGISTVRRLW